MLIPINNVITIRRGFDWPRPKGVGKITRHTKKSAQSPHYHMNVYLIRKVKQEFHSFIKVSFLQRNWCFFCVLLLFRTVLTMFVIVSFSEQVLWWWRPALPLVSWTPVTSLPPYSTSPLISLPYFSVIWWVHWVWVCFLWSQYSSSSGCTGTSAVECSSG